MDRKIGILGGMGPMASQVFYKMVTEMTDAQKDQDHVRMVIYSDPSMPDRTAAILSGEEDDVRSQMLADAKLLEGCGCEAIGITCNTAHYFADQIEKSLEIPIIHMIKETVKEIATTSSKAKVAILATDGTIKTGLYQKHLEEAGLAAYVPEKDIQELVMYEIYDRIKTGLPCDKPIWNKIAAAVIEAGCNKAILACTELSVIKAEEDLSDFYVDPMEVLAARVIDFSGKKRKINYLLGE